MKPGAGDDLLDDDPGDRDETDDRPERTPLEPPEADADEPDGDGEQSFQLPWKHRRDTVKSDRPEIIQMHVRESTVDGEAHLQDDVEDLLGEDVYALDLREAAYLVAMEHPDEVADQLREWGYDFD